MLVLVNRRSIPGHSLSLDGGWELEGELEEIWHFV